MVLLCPSRLLLSTSTLLSYLCKDPLVPQRFIQSEHGNYIVCQILSKKSFIPLLGVIVHKWSLTCVRCFLWQNSWLCRMVTDLSHTVSLTWSSDTYGHWQEMAILAVEQSSQFWENIFILWSFLDFMFIFSCNTIYLIRLSNRLKLQVIWNGWKLCFTDCRAKE